MTASPQIQQKFRKHFRNEKLYSKEKLITIRKTLGLTRQDVVNLTGLSKDTLFNLETGRVKSPELNTFIMLGEVYGVCPGEFLHKNPRPNYIHCNDIEVDLIKEFRKYPNVNIKSLTNFLKDRSTKTDLIMEFIRDVLVKLPEPIIKDYLNLSKDIIDKLSQEQEQTKKNNIPGLFNHINSNN